MLNKRFWLVFLILLLAVAACTSDGTEPAAAPGDAAEQVAEEALPAARLALAEFLGVDPDTLELQTIEDAEWPNACLGLPAPGEMCAEVITPGFLITFALDGDKYAVRTDRSGREVRVEAAAAAQPPSDELPPAVQAARAVLAQQLDVGPEVVEVLSFERQEWSDSCLGLGGPAESCAAVITPGWQVMLGVAGEVYEVRTDETGAEVRVADAAAAQPADELPPVVQAARAELAQQLDVEPGAVEVLSFERREWSDACLGLGGPAEICAAVITPGWQVMLGVAGEVYEVHTDETGAQVRVADEAATQPAGEIPGPELDGAVLFYQRSGGLAGEIVTVRVYPDGMVERVVGPPEPETPVEAVPVEPVAVETLLADLEAAGYFELERSYLPQDTCCDRTLYLISVQGEDAAHTVEALEATPDTPEALQQSIDVIETFITDAFGA